MTSANDKPQEPMDNLSGVDAIPEAVLIRRQARAAEKELAQLKAECQQLQADNQTLTDQLNQLRTEQQIRQAAEAAGAIDSETVCLLLSRRIGRTDKPDIPEMLEQLRREKRWLFAPADTARPLRTAGQRVLPDRTASLQQAAGKAERSGRLNDVQVYLRVRRQFV